MAVDRARGLADAHRLKQSFVTLVVRPAPRPHRVWYGPAEQGAESYRPLTAVRRSGERNALARPTRELVWEWSPVRASAPFVV